MFLLAGLGNPGAEHARQRHNIGFMAVERIAEVYNFGAWRRRFQGEAAEGVLGGRKTLLLKPLTYMNRSGQSLGEAARFYKLTGDDVTVLYDEIDLVPGKVRTKFGGGHAGHNGIRSTHDHLGPDYHRVRIGVGHPGSKERVISHVLGNFGPSDQGWLSDLLDAIADAAPFLAEGADDKFQTRIAFLLRPPEDKTRKTGGET